jgi:WD40 repeat protein
VWDVATGKSRYEFRGHTKLVRSAIYSTDGRHIASASTDRTVRVWDEAIRESRREFTERTGLIQSLAYSPDGRHLVSASIKLCVGCSNGRTRHEFKGRAERCVLFNVVYSPDGCFLASVARHSASLYLIFSRLLDVESLIARSPGRENYFHLATLETTAFPRSLLSFNSPPSHPRAIHPLSI